MNIRSAVLLFASLLPLTAWAGAPDYKAYPAARWTGVVAKPDLSSRKARMFATAITQQLAGGPNFAGHYRLTAWGCGTGCIGWAIVDAQSGSVWFPTFTVEAPDCKAGPCDYALEYRIDSELIMVRGMLNGEGKDGVRYFRWDGKQLAFVSSEPEVAAMETQEPVALKLPAAVPIAGQGSGGAP